MSIVKRNGMIFKIVSVPNAARYSPFQEMDSTGGFHQDDSDCRDSGHLGGSLRGILKRWTALGIPSRHWNHGFFVLQHRGSNSMIPSELLPFVRLWRSRRFRVKLVDKGSS